MSSIEFQRHAALCDRVRYQKGRLRADVVLARLSATSAEFAVRRTKAGIASGPVLWWLLARGVIRQTGSGKLWLDLDRQERLSRGMSVRIVAYVALASLFSGAAMAMASGAV